MGNNVVITAEVTNTETTEIVELITESSSQSKKENILQTEQNIQITNQEDSSETIVITELVKSSEQQTENVIIDSEILQEKTSVTETESFSNKTIKESSKDSLVH